MIRLPFQLMSRSLRATSRFERRFSGMSDAELTDVARSLRFRLMSGTKPERRYCEPFALVREASRRVLGMRHFDVQMLGGIWAAKRKTIEMATGEGKTLTATLPMFLYALAGKGAHLATTNDYLANRDAEFVRPLFHLLGMTVGTITTDMDTEERRKNYACDVTYGTATEFGFDFLRDRTDLREPNGNREPVMRSLYFCLVDEADSVLIDEASTPLIIGAEASNKEAKKRAYRWAARLAPHANERRHYEYHKRDKRVELTRTGRAWCRTQCHDANVSGIGSLELYEKLERAIRVHRDFRRDREYVVRDGEVVIVNQHTGRLGEGREWQDGIHQAIEAKENVPIRIPTEHAARITIQGLFLSYRHLAGMTGTAASSHQELKKVFRVGVVRIPTNLPCQRRDLPPRIYANEQLKWEAVAAEIIQMVNIGRPVLVGTRSVSKSERLSNILTEAGVKHQVLNAHHTAQEADIITRAGQRGAVTISTNVAGRGTDIKLSTEVIELGGLHVILTELHDSPRIDRQMLGRCARQGDPGTTRKFMSSSDRILQNGFGVQRAQEITLQSTHSGQPCSERLLLRAQAYVDAKKRRDRYAMLFHERKHLRSIWQMGLDPVLDTVH